MKNGDDANPIDTTESTVSTLCLQHQLSENQMSRVGLVCAECKRHLYLLPPAGVCRGFWESQPAAYSVGKRRPCFVFTLKWDSFEIRSLHPPGSENDPRGEIVRQLFCPATEIPAPYWALHDETEQMTDTPFEFNEDDFSPHRDWTGDADDR